MEVENSGPCSASRFRMFLPGMYVNVGTRQSRAERGNEDGTPFVGAEMSAIIRLSQLLWHPYKKFAQ